MSSGPVYTNNGKTVRCRSGLLMIYRMLLGKSVDDIVRSCNISQEKYETYENQGYGSCDIPLNDANPIIKALGISITALDTQSTEIVLPSGVNKNVVRDCIPDIIIALGGEDGVNADLIKSLGNLNYNCCRVIAKI